MAPTLPSAQAAPRPSCRAAMHVSTPSPIDSVSPDRIKFDRRKPRNAKHAAAEFAAVAVEGNAVHGGDRVVVDRAKRHDQRRHPISGAGVFIAPRTPRMKAQHRAGKIVRQIELARSHANIFPPVSRAGLSLRPKDVKRFQFALFHLQ